MGNRTILVADDDQDIAVIVQDILSSYDYEVDLACNADEASRKVRQKRYDLLILDVNMPGESGLKLCKQIRETSTLPIIFLSARDSDIDKALGLDIGGDDYIGKPFSTTELVSRVNSLMRRTYHMSERCESSETIRVGDIEINPVSRSVKKKNQEIKLSLKEFDLLLCLARNKNQVVKKEALLDDIWGVYRQCEDNTLSVHIRWLREKLEDDPTKPQFIKTVWRIGFCLCDGENK